MLSAGGARPSAGSIGQDPGGHMPEINIVVFDLDEYKYREMEYHGSKETCTQLLESIRALMNGWEGKE